MPWLLIAILSSLLGSIPWGFLFARAKGIDIRQKGSGNIGAANAVRVMGKKWGYLVFICDFLKGFLAVEISFLLATRFQINLGLASIIAGIMCVVGHDYPAWLGFKGGKGIATLAGVLLAVFPPLVCFSFGAAWVVVFLIGRYTSLASMVAVVTPIAAAWFVSKSDPDFPFLIGFCILMAALALWRHRSNIVRLLNGTENRFGKKSS
jgi:acyl phosphate:glycerol-3-phosphate acyltransferase